MQRYKLVILTTALCAAVVGLVWYTIREARPRHAPTVQSAVRVETPAGEPPSPLRNPAKTNPGSKEDRPIAAVRGQVLDPKGQPVAGAIVTATRVSLNVPEAASATKSVLSDEDGGFALERLLVYTNLIESDQRVYWRIEATAGDQLGVETVEPTVDRREWFVYIGVKPGASLNGIVTDDKNSPVPAAAIRVTSRGTTHLERDAVSALSGAFSVDRLFPGRYLVSVLAAEFAPMELDVTTLSRDPIALKLGKGSALSGRVVDGKGEGVPNLTLKSQREGSSQTFERITSTGASGAFRLTGLRPGTHRIRLSGSSLPVVLAAAPPALTVSEKHDLNDVKIVVEPASVIAGKVVDRATGNPVPGVRVRAESQNAYPRSGAAQTDANGMFRIAGLGDGAYAVEPLHAGATGYLLAVNTKYGLTCADAKLELNLNRVITGVVKDIHGKPVADVSVIAHNATKSLAYTPGAIRDAQTLTDASGAFTLYPPRDVDTVYVQAAGEHSLSECLGPLTIPPVGLSDQNLTLVDTAEVEGIVVDGTGRELANRTVVAQCQGESPPIVFELAGTTKHRTTPFAARTVLGGHFRFTLPAQAVYSLAVEDNGKLSGAQQFDLKPGQLAGGIILSVEDPPGALTGTVTLAGQPVSGAQVTVGATAQTETDESGKFHVEDLEAGEIAITVSWRPGATQTGLTYSHTEQITIAPAETTQVSIELGQDTGSIEGVVSDGGIPVAGARVSIQGDRFGSDSVTTTDNGSFRFTNIPTGTHMVVALSADGESQAENVTVTRNQTTTANVDFATGVLEGTISGLQPADEGEIILLPGNVALTEVTLDEGEQLSEGAAGRAEISAGNTSFRFEHIKPGNYTLVWAIASQSVRNQETSPSTIPVNTHNVQINATEPTRVTLRR